VRAIFRHWRRPISLLRFGSALFAFGAAAFLLMSAWGKLPPIVPYLGYPDDRFTLALASSAEMPRDAPAFQPFLRGSP
jgi:hypothetical protein